MTFRTRRINGKRVASPEYECWVHMRQRCFNPKSKDYPNYGGRGITVCDDWEDFDLFVQDMGPRKSMHMTLDRIDYNGHYDKGNCRWACKGVQSQNRRIVKLTKRTVSLLRAEFTRGKISQNELAGKYGVSRQHVSRVVRGVTWETSRYYAVAAE